jgi:alpha-L-fucosidase
VDGSGETFWGADKTPADLEVDLGKPTPFNVVLIQEMIALGQRVEAFTLEAWDGSQWTEFAKGTTVGHKRLLRVPEVKASKVRLRITQSRGPAMIREFGLYLGPAAPAK